VMLLVMMVVVMVVMSPLLLVGGGDGDSACDIRFSKKESKGLKPLGYVATAKLQGASSRSSQKINGDKLNGYYWCCYGYTNSYTYSSLP